MMANIKQPLWEGDWSGFLAVCSDLIWRRVGDCIENPLVTPSTEITGPIAERERALKLLTEYNEGAQIDEFCRIAQASPTLQALLAYHSHAAEIPIGLAITEYENAPYGEYRSDDIILNNYREDELRRLCQPSILGHELRHDWHRANGLLSGEDFEIFEHIGLVRAYEADSTVMKITMAAEVMQLTGDPAMFNAIIEVGDYSVSAKAFLRAIERDSQALWDGRAQKAAYLAYLQKNNLPILNGYDRGCCEWEENFLADGLVHDRRKTSDDLMQLVRKLFYMPFKNDSGLLIDRPHYAALAESITQDLLLRFMSPSLRTCAASLAAGEMPEASDVPCFVLTFC